MLRCWVSLVHHPPVLHILTNEQEHNLTLRRRHTAYLLVSSPMNGLVRSWTVALEANSNPTCTFSFRRSLSSLGQSEGTVDVLVTMCCVAMVLYGCSPGKPPVAFPVEFPVNKMVELS